MKQEYSLEEQGTHNRNFVNLQVKNLITKLFKDNLNSLEELDLPKTEANRIRKRILDSGNDTIREVHNLIDVFDFYINPDRLEEAKRGRRTVKKFVVNSSYFVE